MNILLPPQVARELLTILHILSMSEMPTSFFELPSIGEKNQLDQDPYTSQQNSVDILYRCFKCGLVELWQKEWSFEEHLNGNDGLISELARVDKRLLYIPIGDAYDDRLRDIAVGVWLAPQIVLTDAGLELVRRHAINNYSTFTDLQVYEFNKDICGIFSGSGVAWTGVPLVKLAFRDKHSTSVSSD